MREKVRLYEPDTWALNVRVCLFKNLFTLDYLLCFYLLIANSQYISV